jgi:hypothetical protein
MLHHRIVAIAIDHARGAAIAHALRPVEIPDIAQRPVPIMAAPQLQMPIQIEILPSREASELFGLAAQVTLHILDRRDRVQYREIFAQRFYRLEGGVQLLCGEVDERRFRAGEVG